MPDPWNRPLERLFESNNSREEEFKPPETAQKVTYEDLARWPQKYANHVVVLHGKIMQVEYDGTRVGLNMDISGKAFSIGEDAVVYWQQPEGQARFLDGDVVDVWGTFTELKVFQGLLHQNMTLPVIKAVQVHNNLSQGKEAAK